MTPFKTLEPRSTPDPWRELLPFYAAALVTWLVICVALWSTLEAVFEGLPTATPYVKDLTLLAILSLGPLLAITVWLVRARRMGRGVFFSDLALFSNGFLPRFLYAAAYGPDDLEIAQTRDGDVSLRPVASPVWYSWFRPLIVYDLGGVAQRWLNTSDKATLVLREERPLRSALCLLFVPVIACGAAVVVRAAYAPGLSAQGWRTESSVHSAPFWAFVGGLVLGVALLLLLLETGRRVVATEERLAIGARVFSRGATLELRGRTLRVSGLCWQRNAKRQGHASALLPDAPAALAALRDLGWTVSEREPGLPLRRARPLLWVACLLGYFWLCNGKVPIYLYHQHHDALGQSLTLVTDARDLRPRALIIDVQGAGLDANPPPSPSASALDEGFNCYVITSGGVEREQRALPLDLAAELDDVMAEGTLLNQLAAAGALPQALESFELGARTLLLKDAKDVAVVGVLNGEVKGLLAGSKGSTSRLSPYKFPRPAYCDDSTPTVTGAPLPTLKEVLQVQRELAEGASLRASLGRVCPGLFGDD